MSGTTNQALTLRPDNENLLGTLLECARMQEEIITAVRYNPILGCEVVVRLTYAVGEGPSPDIVRRFLVKEEVLRLQENEIYTDFKVGDVVRHKSGGQDTIIIRFEDESVDGVAKKLAVCGRFEGQNFQQEIIPVEMLEFVNRTTHR